MSFWEFMSAHEYIGPLTTIIVAYCVCQGAVNIAEHLASRTKS